LECLVEVQIRAIISVLVAGLAWACSAGAFASVFDTRLTQASTPVAFLGNLQSRQEDVNGNSASLQLKDRKAVEVPLPVSMHTGQIIMLTKMLTSADLRFYDFDGGASVETWHSVKNG
jgi:hypothetical protein